MSMGGEIMEEIYDAKIFAYRKKLLKFAKVLSGEYPQDAQELINEFDNHFDIPKLIRKEDHL